MEFTYRAIGIIHSPFKEKGEVPIQGTFSQAEGTIELFPEYVPGLKDIEGFSHLFLIYHFHEADGYALLQKPFLDGGILRGIFATRFFKRPNPIGLSIVGLIKVNGNLLEVSGLDVLDGTPLLDIKPYVRRFDLRENARDGWLEQKELGKKGNEYTPAKLGRNDL